MQVWAQVNLSLHLDNTFLEIVLGTGMVVHSHQLLLILFPGKKKKKQSWKKIRSQFIAHYKSYIQIIETIFQHIKIVYLTLNHNHNSTRMV